MGARGRPSSRGDSGVADGTEQRKQGCESSEGEAEFYALTKSASRALGAVAMAADMAKVVKPRVRMDATASKAIASRRSGTSETSPHPSLVGARGGCATRADHREGNGS